MRKHLSLFLLGTACMSFSALHAQNWVNGGNTLSANGTLGLNSNYSLIFETNNTERGRITNGGRWGIGSTGTSSRFTINSVSGESPFRTQIAGSTKFIVNSNGSSSIGSGTAGPTNGLYVAGSVGIGTATPAYKLQVIGNASISSSLYVGSGGIYGYGGTTNTLGVYGSGSSYGVYGTSPGTGVYGNSSNYGYGVYGNSNYTGVYANGTSYGILSYSNSSSGIGVYGSGSYGLYGSGGAYGLYGNGGSIGVYGTGPTYAVYGYSGGSGRGVYGYSVNGIGGYFYSANYYGLWAATGRSDNYYAAVFDGNTYCYNSYLTSDKSLKQNVEEFGDALSIINKLKPRNYEFRHDGKFAALNLPTGRHYGLIAQELEEVLPNLVKESPHQLNNFKPEPILPTPENGNLPTVTPVQKSTEGTTQQGEVLNIKAVNYTELIPILVKGMQELSQENKNMREELNELKLLMLKVTGQSISTGAGTLLQNVPNPAKSSTNITYSIPDGLSNRAQLLVTDALGRQIKVVQLTTSGSLNLDVSSLASGVYNYSLLVNNKIVETRKLTVLR